MVTVFEDTLTGAEITQRGAQLIFYGGEPDREPVAITRGFGGRLMASDAELVPGAVEAQPDGTLATSAALDPSQLPPRGLAFSRRFEGRYHRRPGRFAAYGYEAMAAILDAIDRASDPGDRQSVVHAFLDTADRDSVVGRYSIDEVGDTTLGRMTGYRIVGGRPVPAAELDLP
jgi:ABC-type branched-subunit amino acid transport system substrate-binding protein